MEDRFVSSTASLQAGPCCCCGFKRDHGIVVCNRSLTEMSELLNDTPPINWSSASVSHLFLMAEARESRLWTGVQSRCFSFSSLLFSYILFSFFTVCVSDPISVHPSRSLSHTHSHTLALSRSLLLFSYKRNSVSLWHLSRMKCVQRENVPLNLSLFNALYEKVLNWVKLSHWLGFLFLFCTKRRGIIFLYCKFSSVFWDAFIWLKLLMNFLQVQCHWINIQWLSLLKVCQLLRGWF